MQISFKITSRIVVFLKKDYASTHWIMGMRESDKLRELFAILPEEMVTAVISLGYRLGEPKQPQHRPLDEVVKFF